MQSSRAHSEISAFERQIFDGPPQVDAPNLFYFETLNPVDNYTNRIKGLHQRLVISIMSNRGVSV